jgi:hypothetical protein
MRSASDLGVTTRRSVSARTFALLRHPGEEVSLRAAYARCQRWCDESEATPYSASKFAAE